MLEVDQESITEDPIFHLHKSQNYTCRNCALLIGDKTVTRCSFIMLSLEPDKHLGHISGIVVNFFNFNFFARKKEACLCYSKKVLHWKVNASRGVDFFPCAFSLL